MSAPSPPMPSNPLPQVSGAFDAVNLLIISTFFPAMLVPVSIALLLFSDAQLRKKPVFIFNSLAVLLGLAHGGISINNQWRLVTGRRVPPDFTTALTCMYFFIPICVQSILLVRILAAYPPRTLWWRARVAIYGTISLVTVARLANVFVAFDKISEGARESPDALAVGEIAWNIPYSRVEWFLQLFYNLFVSTLFLIRLRSSVSFNRKRTHDTSYDSLSTGPQRRSSYSARLRALFYIALSNLVVPVMFNIALIVLVFRDHNVLHGAYVYVVNIYVEIVSVLFATLWCSGTHWQPSSILMQGKPLALDTGITNSAVKFAPSGDVDQSSQA